METSSSNFNISESDNSINENNSNNSDISSEKNEYEFTLRKNLLEYIIQIKIEEIKEEEGKDLQKIIKIKNSQIINNNFYLYEEMINLNYIKKIFPECDNINTGYQKVINLFENKKVEINDIEIDKYILLNLKIRAVEYFELKLLKKNKSEKDIIKELIEKYCSLEKKYNEVKKSLDDKLSDTGLPKQTNTNNNSFNDYVNDFQSILNDYNNKNVVTQQIEEKDDENHITLENYSSIWCMLKLNPINYIKDNQAVILNLVAIGMSGKIVLINLSTMKQHKIIETPSTVYSLTQLYNNSKYLFCSLSNGYIIVYVLKENNDYEEIQRLQKPEEYRHGEINKVIALSNGDLAGADRKSISIWKQKKDKNNNLIDEFEFFKEISTDYDTCHLVEVNPNVFACALYTPKMIKIFNNNGNDYPLLGTINNVESHGSNSNGMAKINENIFCSCGRYYYIYIISVEPIQLIQKIEINNSKSYNCLSFLLFDPRGYIFTSYDSYIMQYKIITDEYNNFSELQLFDTIDNKYNGSKAIITTDDGKIFYQIESEKQRFFLTPFKTS